jgi:hypothetical protein
MAKEASSTGQGVTFRLRRRRMMRNEGGEIDLSRVITDRVT